MQTPLHNVLSSNLDTVDLPPILDAIFNYFQATEREASIKSLLAEMDRLEFEETRVWILNFNKAGQAHTVRIEIFMDDIDAPDMDIDATDPDLSGVLDQLLLRLHPDIAE